ncbi:MAG: hypothetical protein K2N09_06730 [Muribaculaceae bacterium]|nr:hypothetical protein [Muribaculaceae bacterium]
MKSKIKFSAFRTITIAMLMTFFFVACNDEDEPKEEKLGIVGKWECKLDAYGDPWDEPLIMFFDSDGTGYQWFPSEGPFSDRMEFSYVVTSSKLKVKDQYGTYELKYEISSNGKTLIIYGLDDNDMEELWFTRLS